MIYYWKHLAFREKMSTRSNDDEHDYLQQISNVWILWQSNMGYLQRRGIGGHVNSDPEEVQERITHQRNQQTG